MFLRSLRRVCLTPDNEDRKHLQINQQTDRNKSSPQGTTVHILSDFQPFVLSLAHVHHSQEFLVHILCVNQTPCSCWNTNTPDWPSSCGLQRNLSTCELAFIQRKMMLFSLILTAKFRLKFLPPEGSILSAGVRTAFFLTFITSSDPPSPQDLLFPAFHCRYEYNLITHVVHSRLHRFNLNHCSTLWYKLVSHQMTAQTCFTFKITHRYFGH